MAYQAVRGTKDVLPDESYRWHYVERAITEVMAVFNYREIRTPTFEQTELFRKSIGETTDIVTKEMYTFEDMSGMSLTLRPEGTPPVVRAYLEHSLGKKSPLVRVYYIDRMFRHEKPQAGRFRQHTQFGVEAIGSAIPAQDVEVISLGWEVYRRLGFSDLRLRLNSIGCSVCRPVHREKLRSYLRPRLSQLCDNCQRRYEVNPLRIFDCKEVQCQQAVQDAPKMTDYLCPACNQHFSMVQKLLDGLGIPYVCDHTLVRGMDYYTRTTFELVSDRLGAQDTLLGGGRYDGLMEYMGGPPTPAIGFGAGIERLLLVAEMEGLDLGSPSVPDLFLAPLGDEARSKALAICMELRRQSISCEMDTLDRSLKAQMKEADRSGARRVLIIGEDELSRGTAPLRDMETHEQKEIPLDDLAQLLRVINPS